MEEIKINTTHVKGILETIGKYPVFSFSDIFVYYKECSRPTGYNHNLHTLDSIKEAISLNKRKGVTSMLSKWLKSENATLQIAAMRMLCDSEERQKLNQQYVDIRSKEEVKLTGITFEK